MINLVILGSGNVATHLIKAFSKAKDVRLLQVYNHNKTSLEEIDSKVKTTTNLNDLAEADFYILALKDDVIEEIAERIKNLNSLVLHTSGSVSINALKKFNNYGVFYPLQTFSKKKAVNFSEIPLCLEANSAENLDVLKNLAGMISENIYEINSKQRKALHLAAVFVNNFTNHLYTLGAEICQENKVPFEILKPLIKETASKIETLSPKEAQTGPAVRKDQKTIDAHLKMMQPELQEIYKTLTKSIQNFHGKKL